MELSEWGTGFVVGMLVGVGASVIVFFITAVVVSLLLPFEE